MKGSKGSDKTRRLGVLDLGSTSFHLLVADVSRSGKLQPVDRERTQLRLGAVMATRDTVPPETVEKAIRTAHGLATAARAWGAEELFAVGTSALREANNGKELAARLSDTIQAPVRILSGHEEGRLIFAALKRRLEPPSGPVIGLDLGGGSLEIVAGDSRAIHLETTLRLGAARLVGELTPPDPMKKKDLRHLHDRILGELEPIVRELVSLKDPTVIAVGGSARALAHLAMGMRGQGPVTSVRGIEIPLRELRSLSDLLLGATHDERLALPGMRRRRADLLPTASMVFLTLIEAAGFERLVICDWGLREGVLLEAAGVI